MEILEASGRQRSDREGVRGRRRDREDAHSFYFVCECMYVCVCMCVAKSVCGKPPQYPPASDEVTIFV